MKKGTELYSKRVQVNVTANFYYLCSTIERDSSVFCARLIGCSYFQDKIMRNHENEASSAGTTSTTARNFIPEWA